jgi:hypothetical protein
MTDRTKTICPPPLMFDLGGIEIFKLKPESPTHVFHLNRDFDENTAT